MKNIYIIRHGQSTANVMTQEELMKRREYIVDSNFSLTEKGIAQAYEAGINVAKSIKQTTNNECNIYISPFRRTRQTAEAIKSAINQEGIVIKKYIEDPRIVEQDFGDFDFQNRHLWKHISPHSYEVNQARYNDPSGRFFARLENGENLLDVYNRTSLFVTTRLERDMLASNVENYIIVTHANAMRVLKMFLFDMNIECFDDMPVPRNATGFLVKFDEKSNCYLDFGKI